MAPWRLHLGCQNIDLSSASGRWCFAAAIAGEPAIGRRRHAVFGSLPGRSGVGHRLRGAQRGLRRPVASLKARQSFRLRTATSNAQSTRIHPPLTTPTTGRTGPSHTRASLEPLFGCMGDSIVITCRRAALASGIARLASSAAAHQGTARGQPAKAAWSPSRASRRRGWPCSGLQLCSRSAGTDARGPSFHHPNIVGRRLPELLVDISGRPPIAL